MLLIYDDDIYDYISYKTYDIFSQSKLLDRGYTMPLEIENGIKKCCLASRPHDAGRIFPNSLDNSN